MLFLISKNGRKYQISLKINPDVIDVCARMFPFLCAAWARARIYKRLHWFEFRSEFCEVCVDVKIDLTRI